MTIPPDDFRRAMGCFATGVTVVTTDDPDGGPAGLTVNSFSSVSLDPPLVLFCLDRRSGNMAAFQRGGHFAVNMLRDDQHDIALRFASVREDKWDGVDYRMGEGGIPVIAGCLAVVECDTETIHDAGDHIILVGRVVKLDYASDGEPLLYFRGQFGRLGEFE